MNTLVDNRIRILGPESSDYPYWRVEVDGQIVYRPCLFNVSTEAFTLEEAQDYVRAWLKSTEPKAA